MKIKELFVKNINRNIETVIKADDREHISDEIAEYVITKEIGDKIRDLFSWYKDPRASYGVWISGFFGSGKSHLLKILSYVLENKEFDGYKSGNLFAEKIEEDEMLKGDVLAATRIPSESILFNIDQQAQITNKSEENAILSVFYKVFFDHLGYYGYQQHVAEFEMWVDKQGKYHDFITLFQDKFGNSWENARRDYFDPMVSDAVAACLAELNGGEASRYTGIMDELEDRQKQSIEDFCERVYAYIKTKPTGFRLNFFVDEVGQYISDNTKLMLNLQTIAETLATRTKGGSWILVTSQEDMEKVVGDMNKAQLNDFSRIQARFKLKIPLTSANVDEVIEKRLLSKTPEAVTELKQIYGKDSAHLNTLLSFSEAGVQFKGYAGELDFAKKFPLVPYQFDLFQQCRRSLSTHNAFQGKHASVGERSMLGVFQHVVQRIEDKDERALISFDMMYEGVRNELQGQIQSTVIMAENNLDDEFAKRVLKALFLVKYFRNFKPTLRNITVLLINNMDVDLKKHEQMTANALNLLETQSYIQRNGELYEFLTDDEKDVEQEIKNTSVDDQAITNELKVLLFEEIIRDNRIRFIENKQDYDFTSKIDGVILGREKELEIEIITPNYHDYDNITFIQSQTMGSTGMKMILPVDSVFIKDVKMYLKVNKYVRQTQSTGNRPEVKRILQEKAQQNIERKRTLVVLANKLLAESTVYMNGSKHESGHTTDGKTKVINVFQDLVKTVYPNLRMLGSAQFTEDTIKNILRSRYDDLFAADDQTISEAESEVLNLIVRRKQQSDRTSLNDIKAHFSRKPFGWYPNAIWTVTARLAKRGKVEIKQDSNLLGDEEILNALLNSAFHGNTLLEPQVSFDTGAITALKQAYTEAFDESCPVKEAKDVALAFKDKVKGMSIEVNQLLSRQQDYPFLQVLEPLEGLLSRLSKKEYAYFIANLADFEDELLDAKEDTLNPIRKFMSSEQRSIYDAIRTLLKGDTSNLDYIEGDEVTTLRTLIQSPAPYQGNQIREAKAAKDSLKVKVLERIDMERTNAIEVIENAIKDLKSKEEYQSMAPDKQAQVISPLEEEVQKLQEQKYIGNIRDAATKAINVILPNQLNEMVRLAKPATPEGGNINEPQPHYISRTSIRPKFPMTELRSEEDVDKYLEALGKAMKEQIKNNRRINL